MQTRNIIRLLHTKNIINNCHKFLFSQTTTIKQKTYRMPEVNQIKLFKPEVPLRLRNFRALLYVNKQNLTTPMLLQLPYAATFTLLLYLIRYNPWYLTLPASLPMMMGSQIILFLAWMFNKRFYKYMIQRVYITNLNMVQFVFSNKIRRKFKNIQDFHMFITPTQLITPDTGSPDEPEWTHKGQKFPTQVEYIKNEDGTIQAKDPPPPIGYGWTKYTKNYVNYIFPKKYQYANWQILTYVMSGRLIDFTDSQNTSIQLRQNQDYFDIEDDIAWGKQQKKYYKQKSKKQ